MPTFGCFPREQRGCSGKDGAHGVHGMGCGSSKSKQGDDSLGVEEETMNVVKSSDTPVGVTDALVAVRAGRPVGCRCSSN